MVASEFSDVFISYRRANLSKTGDEGIIRRLVRELRELGKEVWIDWEDIPPASTSFSADIEAGLNGCEALIAVLSPDYMESTYCVDLELGTAIKNNKKIIPIMLEDLGDKWSKLPEEVGSINVIFMYPKDGHTNTFEEGFLKIQTALEADYEYRKRHTRLFLDAQEWEENGRSDYMLLSGDNAKSTWQWMEDHKEKTPALLDLQREFITTSYEKQKAREKAERATRRRISDLAHYSIVAIVAQAKTSFDGDEDYDALRTIVAAFEFIDDGIYLEYASVLLLELLKRYSYPHSELVLQRLSDRDNPDYAHIFDYQEAIDPTRYEVKLDGHIFEVIDTLDDNAVIDRYEWAKGKQVDRDWSEDYVYSLSDIPNSKQYVRVSRDIGDSASRESTLFNLASLEFCKSYVITVHPQLGWETSDGNRSVNWETVSYEDREYDEQAWEMMGLAGTKFGAWVQILEPDFFDPEGEAEVRSEFYVQGSWVTGVDWHSDERYLMVCTADSKVYIYDDYVADLIFVLDLPQALHIAWHKNKPELLIRDKDDGLFSVDIEAEGQDYRAKIGDYLPHHSVGEDGLETLSKDDIVGELASRGIPVSVIGDLAERRLFDLAEGYLFNEQSQLLFWIKNHSMLNYREDYFSDDWDYRSRLKRLNGGHKYRLIDLDKQEMVEFIGIHFTHIQDFISPDLILVDGCIVPLKMREAVDYAKKLIESDYRKPEELTHKLP